MKFPRPNFEKRSSLMQHNPEEAAVMISEDVAGIDPSAKPEESYSDTEKKMIIDRVPMTIESTLEVVQSADIIAIQEKALKRVKRFTPAILASLLINGFIGETMDHSLKPSAENVVDTLLLDATEKDSQQEIRERAEHNAEILAALEAERTAYIDATIAQYFPNGSNMLSAVSPDQIPSPEVYFQLDAFYKELHAARTADYTLPSLDKMNQDQAEYVKELMDAYHVRLQKVIDRTDLDWNGDVLHDFPLVQKALYEGESRLLYSPDYPITQYKLDADRASEQITLGMGSCQSSRWTSILLNDVYTAKGISTADLNHLRSIGWGDHIASAFIDESGKEYNLQELNTNNAINPGRTQGESEPGTILNVYEHIRSYILNNGANETQTAYLMSLVPSQIVEENLNESTKKSNIPEFRDEPNPNETKQFQTFSTQPIPTEAFPIADFAGAVDGTKEPRTSNADFAEWEPSGHGSRPDGKKSRQQNIDEMIQQQLKYNPPSSPERVVNSIRSRMAGIQGIELTEIFNHPVITVGHGMSAVELPEWLGDPRFAAVAEKVRQMRTVFDQGQDLRMLRQFRFIKSLDSESIYSFTISEYEKMVAEHAILGLQDRVRNRKEQLLAEAGTEHYPDVSWSTFLPWNDAAVVKQMIKLLEDPKHPEYANDFFAEWEQNLLEEEESRNMQGFGVLGQLHALYDGMHAAQEDLSPALSMRLESLMRKANELRDARTEKYMQFYSVPEINSMSDEQFNTLLSTHEDLAGVKAEQDQLFLRFFPSSEYSSKLQRAAFARAGENTEFQIRIWEHVAKQISKTLGGPMNHNAYDQLKSMVDIMDAFCGSKPEVLKALAAQLADAFSVHMIEKRWVDIRLGRASIGNPKLAETLQQIKMDMQKSRSVYSQEPLHTKLDQIITADKKDLSRFASAYYGLDEWSGDVSSIGVEDLKSMAEYTNRVFTGELKKDRNPIPQDFQFVNEKMDQRIHEIYNTLESSAARQDFLLWQGSVSNGRMFIDKNMLLPEDQLFIQRISDADVMRELSDPYSHATPRYNLKKAYQPEYFSTEKIEYLSASVAAHPKPEVAFFADSIAIQLMEDFSRHYTMEEVIEYLSDPTLIGDKLTLLMSGQLLNGKPYEVLTEPDQPPPIDPNVTIEPPTLGGG